MKRTYFALLTLACALPFTLAGCSSSDSSATSSEAQSVHTPPPAPPASAEATALASFQGEWTLVSFIKDGKTVIAAESEPRKLTVTGKRYVLSGAKEVGNMKIGTLNVEPAQSPKSLTLIADPKDADGKVRFAIYDYSDSTGILRIVIPQPDQRKPDSFDPIKGQSILTFKRAK